MSGLSDFNDMANAVGADAVRETVAAARPVASETRKGRVIPMAPPSDRQLSAAIEDQWPYSDGSVDRFLRTPAPEQQFAVKNRLLANRGHLFTGLGGVSKTQIAIQLGVAFAIGRSTWGWEVSRTGSAAIFLAEDTADNVHRKLAAIAEHGGLSDAERDLVGERVHVFPLAGKKSNLLMMSPGVGLVESYLVGELLRVARSIPDLVFVVLDPALALTEGDEANPAHQRRLGELVDRLAIELNACVVLTSHAAKGLQMAEEIGSHTSRGSGAITDAVRAEYVMRTMTAAEAKRYGISDLEKRKSHVQLVVAKGNELPPEAFLPLWLRRGPGGVLFPAHLEESEQDAGDDFLSKRDVDAMQVLRELTKKGNVTVAEWGRQCVARGVIAGGSASSVEKAIHRIKKSLLTNDLIEPGIGRGVFHPKEAE